ncbi:MAG TPA: AAA family ATPase [Candidatus Saccharimonadales bacterium]|nr:AAA family ATPase [Candidatus Saccharimonadales bacterium]
MAVPEETMNVGGDSSHFAALLPEFQRLDRLLDWAVKDMQGTRGPEATSPFRGLYVSNEDVARLLDTEPGSPHFAGAIPAANEQSAQTKHGQSQLEWLLETFQLSHFDADLMLLALAPEVDLRYEKIFAYLQDDVTRKRPTIELALNLFCPSADEKLLGRARLSAQATLRRNRLLHVIPDPNQVEPPFLAHYLKLDDQVTRMMLGENGLDPRMANECELLHPTRNWETLAISAEAKQVLPGLVAHASSERQPLALYFYGPNGSSKKETAEALGQLTGMDLLVVRCDRLGERAGQDEFWSQLFREARLNKAMLYLSEIDDLRGQDAANHRKELLDAAARFDGITIISARIPWTPRGSTVYGIIPVQFEIPSLTEREKCWQAHLESQDVEITPHELTTLASRFRLTPVQIEEAVTTAVLNSRWRAAQASENDRQVAADASSPTMAELASAARSQCGHDLGKLASKIVPRYGWRDIVLPDDQFAHLKEICQQAENRHIVYGDWGFDRKLSLGKGLNVLFSGPPGTGKTMAAEVLAFELELDLYRIDLSQVINKYLGETEKNLDRIFSAAENSNAILFFDEADALFGKRSEVRDSHDRYANIEISYLLQKMEEYQGISVLATNLKQNLDEAFMRRLQAIVEFPFPDEEFRRRIWESIFPKEAPIGSDVRFDILGRDVRLAGGNIKNMALVAAFYAATDGGTIHMSHLIQAAHREHQKLGRTWSEIESAKAAASV